MMEVLPGPISTSCGCPIRRAQNSRGLRGRRQVTYHLATASSLPAAGSANGHGSQWTDRATASYKIGLVRCRWPAQRSVPLYPISSYSILIPTKDEALKDQLVQSSERSEAPGGHSRMARPQNRLGHGMGERDRRTLEFGGGDSAVDQLRFHRFGVLPRNRNGNALMERRESGEARVIPVSCGEWIDLQQASSGKGRGSRYEMSRSRRGVYERRPSDQGGSCGTDAAEEGKRREKQGQVLYAEYIN